MPGVLAVLTGEDWAAEKFGAPGPVIPRQRRDGSPMLVPLRPALSNDRGLPVGDPVTFIVAENVDLAKDAVERITVEYEPLPSVTASEEALSPDAQSLGRNAMTRSASSSPWATSAPSRRPSRDLITSPT
jgi:carbon-monoxide dehydrogenase large subunit